LYQSEFPVWTEVKVLTLFRLSDTVEKMREYFKKNHLDEANWKIMTSTHESDLRELASLLDFKYRRVAEDEFEHSLAILAADREGVLIGRAEGAESRPEEIIKKIKKIK
jgi:protein SCO1/2